jgi:hypothetical protein
MEQRLSLVTLGAADLERSRAFYERLGWKRAMKDAPGVAFFQLGGVALSLYPLADLARDVGIEAQGKGFAGITLAHNTRTRAEVDAVPAGAVKAGAKLPKPGHDMSWGGHVGCFADPDGFVWEVAWNPGFAIAGDGGIALPP